MSEEENKIQAFMDKKITAHFGHQSELAKAALLMTGAETNQKLYKIEKSLPFYDIKRVVAGIAIGAAAGILFGLPASAPSLENLQASTYAFAPLGGI